MPVVYNGVPGTNQDGLFKGLKLWVAHRVPQRARWVDLVKGNGGEVVRLEKTADMLIADNIKVAGVSPPPGSYMWRWIDDSVKNGFLQDKDDYLIGRREGSARALGATQQTKVSRTAFTRNDDTILTKWIMAEERMGNVVSGNVPYKALERRHPHHTWQSWRDRWVKMLRSRPRPSFSEEEIQAEINEHRAQSLEAAAVPAGPSRKLQPTRASEAQPQSSKSQSVPATSPGRAPKLVNSASSGRAEVQGKRLFTKDEDQLLLDFIEEVRQKNTKTGREVNRNLRGNVIYQAFADEHPAHPWHSWRDRWIRHLSLLEAVDDAGPDEASNTDPEAARPLGKRRLQQSSANGGADVPANDEAPSSGPEPSSAKQQPDPKSDDQRLKRKQRERREARASLLIEKTWRGYAVRRDMARLEAAVVPLQSLMRGYVARMRTTRLAEARKAASEHGEANLSQDGQQYQDAMEDLQDAGVGSEGMSPEDRHPREQFYDDFQVILGAIDVEIDSEPTINGQRIDLWDLYRLARQQDCELEARDWKLVTEQLGFEPVNSLVWRVQACYLQNLADFEYHIKTFESNNGMDEEETEEQEETGRHATAESFRPTSDAGTAPKQPVTDPSSPAYQSSPPIARSKRSLGHSDLLRSDSAYPSSGPRKRRRVDRSSVIPPTPDEKLGLSTNTSDGVAMQDKSSPLKSKAIGNGDGIESSSGDESDELLNEEMDGVEGQDELPSRSDASRRKFVEPETQDWLITRDHLFLDDGNNISPSQQLHLESDAVKSLDQFVPNSGGALAEDDRFSPAAVKLEDVANTRVLRSAPRRAVVSAPLTSSSRDRTNGKVTKRTLPASYRRKTAPTAGVTVKASVPSGRTESRPQAQPDRTTMARPSSTSPVRATNSSTSRSGQLNAYATTPAMRPSTDRFPALSRSGPHPIPNNKEVPASQNSETWDEARVEAQFSHFQALGYKTNHIHQAMEAATMSRGPMIVALDSLSKGGGLPQDEAGVWTPRDCSDLLKIKKYERQVGKGKGVAGSADGKMKVMAWNLEKKHTKQGVEARWKFMQLLDKTDGV